MRRIGKAAVCMLLAPLVTSCAAAAVSTPNPAVVEEAARRSMAGSIDGPVEGPGVATGGTAEETDRPRIEPRPANARQDDTLRYTVIINGHLRGERRMWRERPATWRYEYKAGPEGFYHFPRTEGLTLDGTGLPVRLEVEGEMNLRDTWEETFELEEGHAQWTALVRKRLFPADPPDLFRISPFEEIGILERADTTVVAPAYYAAVHPAHDVGVVARALLHRPSRRLPLLPAGEAWLEPLGQRLSPSRTGGAPSATTRSTVSTSGPLMCGWTRMDRRSPMSGASGRDGRRCFLTCGGRRNGPSASTMCT